MTIKEFRLSQGLSQPKLAKALGIGVSTVGGYESGRIQPSQKVIDQIKAVFGVDLAAVEAAPAKKTRSKKATPAVEAAPVEPAPAKRTRSKKAAPSIVIQSPMGGEITADQILLKVGDVDKVYVRVDQNAIYWVKGDESGALNIW